jgi:uncharacterized repeat protein (TIGR02543 family)
MNKIIRVCLVICAISLLGFLSACDKSSEVQVRSISINEETLMESYELGAFDLASVELNVRYSDGHMETIDLDASMIEQNDRTKLSTTGTHEITVNYQERTVTFVIEIFEVGLDTTLLLVYQLGVESGSIDMTYEEWLDSIRGEDGKDGKNVLFQVADGYIQWKYEGETTWQNLLEVSKLIGPTGEDGTDGNDGEDGVSIIDASLNEDGELVFELSDGMSINVGNVMGSDGLDGLQGEDGIDGIDGLNGVDGVGIESIVISTSGELVVTLTDETIINLGNVMGSDGEDGISIIDATINEDGELVFERSDGTSINVGNVMGSDGLDGLQGEDGINGIDGLNGVDGVGIESIVISTSGELVVTLTDETVINLGNVVGSDGEDGISIIDASLNEDGELVFERSDGMSINVGNVMGSDGLDGVQGEDGINGIDGLNGVDGVGLESITINTLGELVITLTDETVLNLGNVMGSDGTTPHIGSNGNWFIGDVDTGIRAQGEDGQSAYEIYLEQNPDYQGSEEAWVIDLINGTLPIDGTYTITFEPNGGDAVEPLESIDHGSLVDLPIPIREGYDFMGWFRGESMNDMPVFNHSVIKSDLTLYARWELKSYLVTFMSDDALVSNKYFKHGESIVLPTPENKEGYAFNGWDMDVEIVKEPLVLNALWEPLIVETEFHSTHVPVNEVYQLPLQIRAVNSEGNTVNAFVKWEQDEFVSAVEGHFIIEGQIDFYDQPYQYSIHVSNPTDDNNIISGYVIGLVKEDVSIVVSNNTNIWTTRTDDTGYFEFKDLLDDSYVVKIDETGYTAGYPVQVNFIDEIETNIASLGMTDNNIYDDIRHISFHMEEITADGYYYEWFFSGDAFGYETAVKPVDPRNIKILDENYVADDSQASLRLQSQFDQYLVNTDLEWNNQYASRILEIFNRIPFTWNSEAKRKTLWMLTNDHLADDIKITYGDEVNEVLISTHVFTNATKRLVELDGLKGIYYSNRLYHAVVKFVTSEGENIEAVDHILTVRFGVTIRNIDYESLTVLGESAEAYQQFKPNELLQILAMFEEMPSGFHSVEGLEYLVRRKDGAVHPIYPDAPAVAWVTAGYIEFMESAFTTFSSDYLHRLIVHEKAHFMWEHLFSEELKENWIELGGWYETDETSSGWATTKTTEFVSSYAHAINPDEDMAESISFYLVNPDQLRARAPGKYEFIDLYIMKSTRYLSVIREDLTFEVYNLWPDYDYPGKIIRTKVNVEGLPEEDKTITVEIELNNQHDSSDGASSALMRIYSVENENIFFDLYLYPIDEMGHVLRGDITISKFIKSGYYTTDQMTVTDLAGNQRFEGQGSIGFKAYINNPLEDLTPPILVEDSFSVDIMELEMDDHQVFQVDVSFEIIEENILLLNTAHLYISATDGLSYSYQSWGWYDEEENRTYIRFFFTEFHPNAFYEFGTLSIKDLGGNTLMTQLHLVEGFNEKHRFYLDTNTPDSNPPEVDTNRITVQAQPTHPEAPNGETLVTINFYARDDLSGLGEVYYELRNPLGQDFGEYHYHTNFHTMFFEGGDPTVWTMYTINVLLPEGSVPGIWGLLELAVSDKASNIYVYNFAEIVTFEVIPED